ncbi:LytTR family two component transcriptional regulator [Algoriphagus boseongensis]|uniref:LytTR family two component transcriptional regulator n=1 Tax=Algoriphagus boseongensis TaxID=1442587 RepID=A0A4R6TAL4_9BACT|nr:LytTR family DNA-binding domain-containing protein [Algoriphagus boseongensis]TDQ19239.1 LytTR family two component transcriptional regulator [Algoriphagus boseongensis]
MIRVALVDDEPKSILSLEWEIQRTVKEVEIVGKFREAEEAINKLPELSVDCVFLDISMPKMDGFRFLEYFPNRDFEVVFVTAYAEHAIQAIRERAFDYLLKPVENAYLERVLERILMKKNQKESRKISINRDDQLILIDPEEVLYCESEGSYSQVTTLKDGKILVSKRLKLLEDVFSGLAFFRIHHSFLINLKWVKSYEKSTGKVVLEGGIKLPVSRLKRAGFIEALK